MDDYSGLAARAAAGVGGLRGVLILSRDGLVLGAHPEDDERLTKPSWLRFATLGEPERSFVEFADQVWVYVHRGPYAAFAVADAGVRPGLVIDQLEQALLTAEESRTRRDGLRAPDAPAAAAGPRTTLHPTAPAATPAPVVVPVAAEAAASPPADRPAPSRPARSEGATEPSASSADAPVQDGDPGEPPTAQEAPAEATESGASTHEPPKHEAPKLMTTPVTPKRGSKDGEESEVDRVLLAQEFSGLLQDPSADDEGSS